MIVIQDEEASSAADHSYEQELRPKHNEKIASHEFARGEPVVPVRKIAFWIECTLFIISTYLFSFPLRVCNNRVSL